MSGDQGSGFKTSAFTSDDDNDAYFAKVKLKKKLKRKKLTRICRRIYGRGEKFEFSSLIPNVSEKGS